MLNKKFRCGLADAYKTDLLAVGFATALNGGSIGDVTQSAFIGFLTGVIGGVGTGMNAAKLSLVMRDGVSKSASVWAALMAYLNAQMITAADIVASSLDSEKDTNKACP